MAVDPYSIDSLRPDLLLGDTNAEKVGKINDYLYQVLESLRYTFYHLDIENFDDDFLDNLKKEIEADIGSIDLSGYVTRPELTAALADYVTRPELADYATHAELQNYAPITELANYVPTSSLGDISVNSQMNLNLQGSNGLTLEGNGVLITANGSAGGLGAGLIDMECLAMIINAGSGQVNINAAGGLWVNGTRIA